MNERSIAVRCAGFLTRIRKDVRGNTLAIVGAALVPLTAMIGSGVDMSRAYMAKTRLQSACDAAALAGRRIMQNDTLDTSVTNEATRFFRYNFPQGLYQTANFNPVVSRPSANTVRVTASTTMSTSVMRMFGFSTLPLDVECEAFLSYVNTDIMLVLDTTGSMDRDINDNYTNAASNKKIFALRNAVMALYDELRPVQTQLENAGLRLRYGVVPYSSTVNVGALIRGVSPSYLVESASYQTRVAQFDQPVGNNQGTSTQDPPVVEIYSGTLSRNNCGKYGENRSFGGFSPSPTSGGGPAPAPSWTRVYSNDETAGVDWGWPGAPVTSGKNRSCRRRYVQTNTTYQNQSRYEASGWVYQTDEVDVSDYRMGTPVRIADDYEGESDLEGNLDPVEAAAHSDGEAGRNVTWNGCIEERDTVDSITAASGYAIPSGAYDLDIDLIPHDDETRWRPMFPQITYYRTTSLLGYLMENSTACPAAAVRLTAWNRGNMESYVQQLNPAGNTYHNIGMVWGVRMLSSGGIFADSPATYNGMPVSRHLIFMTDGQMDTDNDIYHAYGIEAFDQRTTGMSSASEDERNSRHLQRFKMICNAAKGMNISIWVIAFGTSLSNEMRECASNSSQASTAADSAALISRFRQIGSNIGALRLAR